VRRVGRILLQEVSHLLDALDDLSLGLVIRCPSLHSLFSLEGTMRTAIAAALAVMLAGCGGPNLSFSVRAGSPATGTLARGALTVGNGIVLNRLRVVIRKVELEKAGTLEMDEIASGPYLLDLSGTGLDAP